MWVQSVIFQTSVCLLKPSFISENLEPPPPPLPPPPISSRNHHSNPPWIQLMFGATPPLTPLTQKSST
ncbi:hypothetical protein L6452_09381 [Arctium lappa]|uniref:Uncharacterized protein n=1 Tax=Arctium lappa TaxID=4217 RepID=A0ACB9DJW7_ARCLA|nr:hypothetical protein L6452_09381 [Arctium lappa]